MAGGGEEVSEHHVQYTAFPALPVVGPDVKHVGKVKKVMQNGKFGFVQTDEEEEIFFASYNILGTDEPKVGDNVALNYEHTSKGPKATLVIPISADSNNGPVRLARIKSFSVRNGYGFTQLLNVNRPEDIHFLPRVCTTDTGLQKDRIVAIQIDNTVEGKPKCSYLQPFLDQEELNKLQASGSHPHDQDRTDESDFDQLPNVDLTPMGLQNPRDPHLIFVAQQAAARAVQQVLIHTSATNTTMNEHGYQHSYPWENQYATAADAKHERETTDGNSMYVGIQSGKVKSWSSANKYGFLQPDHGGDDVHVTLCGLTGCKTLVPGDIVNFTYDVSELPRRRAAKVWVISGSGACGPVRNNHTPSHDPYPVKMKGGMMLPPPPPPPPPPMGKGTLSMPSENVGAGTVKSYNPSKGYGFLVCDASGKDIYFSAHILSEAGIPGVTQGARLGYTMNTKGSGAASVWRM
eukprot:TRINITY_DN3759_c0_g1_i3.p1 TRINITY_DN3759_c0_g1~~TRINITY_DN3759_c0_g1_i3.p1  ORF type:complete len:505 (+),score=143.72 TRINITY_DN3759_c0_g1_i3:131-1516(+)